MGKKSTKIEMDMRINRVARLLANGAVRSEILQYAAKEWEASDRTADTYIARARELIRADWETDRLTFTAEILAQLATLQKEARKQNNLGAALGCIKTAAQIAQVLQ
jgi:hypothetical protein|tara:strand:- start:15155 stop:15475 length:321 start_codon:yes stop_codon:yes gene_type:complete